MIKIVLKNISLWKDSLTIALGVIAFMETILTIAELRLSDLISINKIWFRGILIVGLFIVIWLIITFVEAYFATRKVSFKIRDTKITIQCGDIFKSTGWKIIPFNEFYDTCVDDVIIAHNSLNGKFISDYVSNVDDLIKVISQHSSLRQKNKKETSRLSFPLGSIITYEDYMLLAFSHFQHNQARLTHVDYEKCLYMMWKEISRVYANCPITIPLLGSGITRFEDIPKKTDSYLLECMLYTLKTSNAKIYQPITIVLTQDSMRNLNLYDLKNRFKR